MGRSLHRWLVPINAHHHTVYRQGEVVKMSQRGVGRSSGGLKKRMAVSYTIRDVKEPLNRAGVNALAIDPAKKLLYTAGRDAIIRCWDISEAHGQKQCSYVRSLEHHTDWINDIALCSNGRYMMSASSDTTLKVWDTTKGSCLSTLRTHKDYVRCLAYAKEKEQVASAGLDRIIYLWDIQTLTSLTAAKNTVTTTTLPGHKESIYSLAMNDAGTVLVSGSTEKLIRVWDPRTSNKMMKLKGHTDNVRTVVLNREGSLCLSGSSDGTVRLWSLAQQRCVETFRVHDEGVWALTADEEFEVFYSGGRDRQVCATELTAGGQDGVVLFCEDSPILNLTLDPCDDNLSIWAATTSTHVNKWPVDPSSVTNGKAEEGEGVNMDEEEEEEVAITDIDDPQPIFIQPMATIPGGRSIRDFRILNNRQQVLTKDSAGDVALWDVLHAVKEEDLGQVDIDDEAKARRGKMYIPNWFSVEVKTGMLAIRLEESDCFSAWVMGNNARLDTVGPELKLNLGALTLQALFEHWPSTHTSSLQEETRTVEKGSSPAPPPQLEDLMEVCGGESVKDWEGIGKALSIPDSKLEVISLTHKDDVEKSKEDLFKMWLKESEDVTWERVLEALSSAGLEDIAKTIKERFCSPPETEEVSKPSEQTFRDKVYFSVPEHTSVVLSEVGDCGTTMMRFMCGDAGGAHENRQLNNFCPPWVMDITCQKKLPEVIKINFSLGKYEPGKKESKTSSGDRLSAQDLLTIRKVHDYAYNKVYGEEGKLGPNGERLEADTCLEILCMDQVLDKDLDLRTVKYSIWKSGGDMKLFYREVDPLPKADENITDNGESTKTADSEQSKEDDQEPDKACSEEATQAQEEAGNGVREEAERGEEQLVAEMDGEEQLVAVMDREEGGDEKMEDNRTEEKS